MQRNTACEENLHPLAHPLLGRASLAIHRLLLRVLISGSAGTLCEMTMKANREVKDTVAWGSNALFLPSL